ncbi:MAG: hypothetical protein SVK54_02030 [candidate division WOR-3 bacterium]|nr:hypothetical protein [candidate division WOR-3 bacterium]
MKKFLLISIIAVIAAVPFFAENIYTKNGYYIEDIEEKIDLSKSKIVTVTNKNGSVNLEQWSKDYAEIKVQKIARKKEYLKYIELKYNNSADKLDIFTDFASKNFSDIAVNYTVRIPGNCIVEMIKTSNGAIDVKSITSDIMMKTSNAAISADNVSGTVKAYSSNGPISIKDAAGIGEIITSNGLVKADIPDTDSDCTVKTSNAPIEINLEGFRGKINARTSNGAIKVEGSGLTIDKLDSNQLRALAGDKNITLSIVTSNSRITIKK